MEITHDILKAIAPGSRKSNYRLLPGIALWMNYWFPKFDIDTIGEVCHFIAQTAHESDSYNTFEEYASGKAYEGRKDLGNVVHGDGVRYKGRGPIQTTGRANYSHLDILAPQYFDKPISFIRYPTLLNEPQYGIWSACVFWDTRDLNTTANMKDGQHIWVKKLGKNLSPLEYITWRVNGGFNGLSERKKFYDKAKDIIK